MRSKGTLALIVVLALVALGGCAACTNYNDLVSAQENVRQAWANVEAAYQRRADLIPNLVATVKGAAEFERETLTAVTEARAQATSINVSAEELGDPQAMQRFMAAQEQLSGALGRLLVVAEDYPQLRATGAFRDLQAQLEGTENRITVARRDYNTAVARYNTTVRTFPNVLFANLFGFESRTPFEAEAGAEQAPDVTF